jgi:hypothetical protein
MISSLACLGDEQLLRSNPVTISSSNPLLTEVCGEESSSFGMIECDETVDETRGTVPNISL